MQNHKSLLEVSNDEISDLLETINHTYGYDFSQYARASIKRRIINVEIAHGIRSVFELKKKLMEDEKFFALFLEQITVNVTEMFRDPSFYKSVREKVIPRLRTYPFVKIWHAGCSTGEEIYSMAILMQEEGMYDKVKIYGTDINQRDLTQAKEGVFRLDCMQQYAHNYFEAGGKRDLAEYYIAQYKREIFSSSLKKNMVFAVHNLAGDKSFNEFNLIVCRNVLIYFNRTLQDKVIKLFYDSLCIFGYLILGSKESLLFSEYRDSFEVVNKEEKIFRRIK